MKYITDVSDLSDIYPTPGAASLRKVADRLTPAYAAWIKASRFCTLSTVGVAGTDCSPRGDVGPAVRKLDDKHLAMPDWRGNNRMDSLRNIVEDGRVSLMFMVPGSNTIVRINGTAKLTRDPDLCRSFEQNGINPRTVIVIQIGEVYFQCSRAPMRSELWTGGDQSQGLPSPGDFLAELTDGEVGGKDYDAELLGRAAKSMW